MSKNKFRIVFDTNTFSPGNFELLDLSRDQKDMTIERTAVYRFRARIVDRFSKGRAFLVGDAAGKPGAGLGRRTKGRADIRGKTYRTGLCRGPRLSTGSRSCALIARCFTMALLKRLMTS